MEEDARVELVTYFRQPA